MAATVNPWASAAASARPTPAAVTGPTDHPVV
ncbi:MAG: hypothetical protein JWO38_63, partial [Gemmataceae bacterium]|nr:hypothetical protein [Gemmataceae bacterium]